MKKFLLRFRRNEEGAVTVDWVVLTAAVAGLAIAVIASVSAGATNKSTGLGTRLSNQTTLTF